MKAVGYIRVSTEDQAREGVSLENQESKIKAFAYAKGWDLVEIYADDGKSAKDLNREGIQKVIEGCEKRGFDIVIVYKLDRLTRNIRDLGYLIQDVFERYGVDFSSVMDNFDTTTASGRLVLNVMGSVAQWEREIISERTEEALRFKKRNGERVGTIPLGFMLTGDKLEPVEEELAIVRQAKSLRAKGLSYQRIANRLNEARARTKQGGRWFASTVRYLLSNDIYSQFA